MKIFYLMLVPFLVSGCFSNNSVETNDSETKIHNTSEQNSEAALLFEKCQQCHGADAKNRALGHSRSIADLEKQDIKDALNGYKNETRNIHGHGPLMKGQVAELTEYEIKILSDYISQF